MNLENIIFTNPRSKLKKIKILLLLAASLLWGSASAEEVFVEVVRISGNSQLSWTISNNLDHTMASSEDYLQSDTFAMVLEADQRFRLNLNIDEEAPQDTDLLLLKVNGAGIMLIKSDIGQGEFSYPFFTGYKQPVLKIVGGSDADIEDFPWQVYFRAGNYQCGGSIISKRWILTAAHCTQDGEGEQIIAGQMKVKVGTATPYNESSGKWYYVKNYIVHEDYNNSTLVNDIALLELYNEIDFTNAEIIELISVQEVDSGATDPGVQSLVSGWGLSGVDPDESPSILQKAELPLISNATAASVWGKIPSTILMAGYIDGSQDACSGDSGGPLVVSFNGESRLAGVVSWGSENCNTYGGFTRVSSYLDWIEEQTKAELSTPVGQLKVCPDELSSTYVTDPGDSSTFEWEISPEDAGVVSFDEEVATIVWNPNFFGTVRLYVRAEIDGTLTKWATESIEVGKATVLLSSPDDLEVCEGDVASFFVETDGYNLTYNWFKDGVFYNSSSSATLAYNSSNISYSGAYYCVVESNCGEVTTDIFNLTVHPNTEIISIPEDEQAVLNDDVHITVNTVGHDLQYQWFKDGDIIVGATDSVLSLAAVDANDIGLYHVEVEGACMSDVSDEVYLYVGSKLTDDVQARIWPSFVTTELNTAVSTNELYSLEVFNMKGLLIYSEQDISNQYLINASAWTNGSYVVKISSKGFSESYRILKK